MKKLYTEIPPCAHYSGIHRWAERVSDRGPYVRYCARPGCGLLVEGPWPAPTLITVVRAYPKKKRRLPSTTKAPSGQAPKSPSGQVPSGPSAARAELLLRLQERDGPGCFYCGQFLSPSYPLRQDSGTVDHFVPLSKGGANAMENLRASCFLCNHAKGNLMPPVFEQMRLGQLSKQEALLHA